MQIVGELCTSAEGGTQYELEEHLKLFNFEYENVKFSMKFFDQNHPKILRMTEISIFNICIHQVILTGEIIFSLAKCQG